MVTVIRQLLFTMALLLSALPVFSQDTDQPPPASQSTDVPYRVFHTKNIYNVLELDTRTGRIWQVQWGDVADRGHTPLNVNSLLPTGTAEETGRFTLYATKNIWTFILLDQKNGRTWQIQWGFKASERFISEIQ